MDNLLIYWGELPIGVVSVALINLGNETLFLLIDIASINFKITSDLEWCIFGDFFSMLFSAVEQNMA